jgi:hypothetical protein
MSASETLETVTGTEGTEGFYRSFDDIDDIDLGVLASSNPLEAAVVLRNQSEAHQVSMLKNLSFLVKGEAAVRWVLANDILADTVFWLTRMLTDIYAWLLTGKAVSL